MQPASGFPPVLVEVQLDVIERPGSERRGVGICCRALIFPSVNNLGTVEIEPNTIVAGDDEGVSSDTGALT